MRNEAKHFTTLITPTLSAIVVALSTSVSSAGGLLGGVVGGVGGTVGGVVGGVGGTVGGVVGGVGGSGGIGGTVGGVLGGGGGIGGTVGGAVGGAGAALGGGSTLGAPAAALGRSGLPQIGNGSSVGRVDPFEVGNSFFSGGSQLPANQFIAAPVPGGMMAPAPIQRRMDARTVGPRTYDMGSRVSAPRSVREAPRVARATDATVALGNRALTKLRTDPRGSGQLGNLVDATGVGVAQDGNGVAVTAHDTNTSAKLGPSQNSPDGSGQRLNLATDVAKLPVLNEDIGLKTPLSDKAIVEAGVMPGQQDSNTGGFVDVGLLNLLTIPELPNGPGLPGLPGTDGLNGLVGAVGAAGADGLNGVAGIAGTAGSNGLNGLNGLVGMAGTAGVNGLNGVNGLVGAVGTAGSDGLNGIVGLSGTNGTNGTGGTNGSNGVNSTVIVNGGGGGGGGGGALAIGGTPFGSGQANDYIAGLTEGDRASLLNRCKQVVRNAKIYNAALVASCKAVLARLDPKYKTAMQKAAQSR